MPDGHGDGPDRCPIGGYYVTIPFWQIVEQYLYGNVSYSDRSRRCWPTGWRTWWSAFAGTSGQIIPHSYRHLHWTNCIYQDRWVDNGGIRQ